MYNTNNLSFRSFSTLIGICFLVVPLFVVYTNNIKDKVDLSLTIYNSFSGSFIHIPAGENTYLSGDTMYSCLQEVSATFAADVTSSWEVMGDTTGINTGIGTGNYTLTGSFTLSPGDGEKIVTSHFFVGVEALITPSIKYFLDTTSPSTPIIILPTINRTVTTQAIHFKWTASVDTGAGFESYNLIISNHPSFFSPQIFTTTNTSLIIDTNLLPSGELYRYVQARDKTCNTINSLPSFFTIDNGNNGNNHGDNGNNGNHGDNGNNGNGEHPSAPPRQSGITSNIDYYIPHQYTKAIFTPISDIKAYLQGKNTAVLISYKKRLLSQEHYTASQNAYEKLIIPGYLQKTGADPHLIMRKISILAQIVSPKQRNYLYNIIHQLLPNRTAGIILCIFILLYDIQTGTCRYYKYMIYNNYHKGKKYKKTCIIDIPSI